MPIVIPELPPKQWWKSKTLWLNGIATFLAMSTAMADMFPAEYLPYVMAAQGVANIVLRLLKNEQVQPIGSGE